MAERTQVARLVVAVVALSPWLARGAAAAEPTAAPDAGPTTTPAAAPANPAFDAPTAAGLLAQADAAVDAGNLTLARALYERVVNENPGAPEASEARRALKILAAGARLAAPPPAAGGEAPAGSGVVLRREPYSTKTKERLRLTTWEKLDFGTTAFLYGMSVGFSYGLSLQDQSSGNVLPPIAIGALAYTVGAAVFLNTANPDRGDLPLALAITSYAPTTTLLIANFAFDHPDGRKTALATAATGLLSVPVAVYAAHELDLDPGDTQLVRDAGFWGLALGTTGMLGFGGSTQTQFGYSTYTSPTGKAIATAGFLGLYGGLGLGLAAAHATDVSLERVRVSTWGGYGGAIVGLLLAGAMGGGTETTYRGVSIGALAGLVVTFAATSGLDGIPPEDVASSRPAKSPLAATRLTPTFAPMTGLDGQSRAMLGLSGSLF
jgi:hypothetical protein